MLPRPALPCGFFIVKVKYLIGKDKFLIQIRIGFPNFIIYEMLQFAIFSAW